MIQTYRSLTPYTSETETQLGRSASAWRELARKSRFIQLRRALDRGSRCSLRSLIASTPSPSRRGVAPRGCSLAVVARECIAPAGPAAEVVRSARAPSEAGVSAQRFPINTESSHHAHDGGRGHPQVPQPFEGEVREMYLDNPGLVTTGVGNLLQTAAEANQYQVIRDPREGSLCPRSAPEDCPSPSRDTGVQGARAERLSP